jgi:AmmeMemoRadiSam system protein B
MRLRLPIAAGRFYPSDASECVGLLDEMAANLQPVPAVGAIAPHAGWIYSGRTATRSIISIAAKKPGTVMIFGAVHVPMRHQASLFGEGAWESPLGAATIDSELADLIRRIPQVRDDPESHRFEHSIEVLLPIIQRHLPDARILPLMVQPGRWAEQIGRECAKAAIELGRRVAYLASTDLTHYGPAFGIEPAGHGETGVRWAKEVNDRRLIELIAAGQAAQVVPEAALSRSACGAGAVAALMGAMAESGATEFRELEHTSSAEVEHAAGGAPVNSVGYLAAVFLEHV